MQAASGSTKRDQQSDKGSTCIAVEMRSEDGAARAAGKRSAAARGAVVSTIPDGNHGDNLQRTPMGRMSAQHTPGPTRYKVEHCDTRGVWVPLHRGTIKRYADALAKKQAFCRILVDYLGNGVWEEIETLPRHTQAWEAEKRAAIAKATGSAS